MSGGGGALLAVAGALLAQRARACLRVSQPLQALEAEAEERIDVGGLVVASGNREGEA